jgi:hypothetical protein
MNEGDTLFYGAIVTIIAAVGGLYGLAIYIGYRAGYAKAIETIKFGMQVAVDAHLKGQPNAISETRSKGIPHGQESAGPRLDG